MMRFDRVAIVTFACLAAGAAAATPPPATPTVPAFDTYFGKTVQDPYRWLENGSDPDVVAWTEAQAARARSALDAIAVREPIKKELSALTLAASPTWGSLKAAGDRLFAILADPKLQQARLVSMGLDADPDAMRVVLDPNALDPSGHTAIDWYVPSHDGKRVAVSLSQGGSEDGTLHVVDVETGKDVGETIPRVQYPTGGGSAAWSADDKGLWYTRYPGDEAPAEDRHFNMQVYYHALGSDWKADPLVLGTADGIPRIGEVFLDTSGAPDLLLVSVANGDGGEWAHWTVTADGQKARITQFTDGVVAATVAPDRALVMVSVKDASNGKVLRLAAGETRLAKAKTIVPEGKSAIVDKDRDNPRAPTLAGSRMLVSTINGGPNEVVAVDLDGKHPTKLPLPEIASFSDVQALPSGDVIVQVATYLRPPYYAILRAKTGKLEETRLAMTSPATFDDAEVVRAFATSKDGTRVPLNIIRRKGLKLDGRNPVLLNGYGGYGINLSPTFGGPLVRTWLDGGGVWVVANLRGGGEYGRRWHEQGNLLKKQNVFDDFAAAARYLVEAKYTDREHLSLLGGSNGGLLMGATMTQHPDIAKAIVSTVGVYDMLRQELDPNGTFNVTEYGTTKDPALFKALYAYSPYHHVVKGTKYPALLLMTGANDGRVNPMHSRKFAAALQAAQGGDAPVWLRISTNSGHGMGTSVSEKIEQQADYLAFLFDQLGMKLKP